jgi:hypothetical protein
MGKRDPFEKGSLFPFPRTPIPFSLLNFLAPLRGAIARKINPFLLSFDTPP